CTIRVTRQSSQTVIVSSDLLKSLGITGRRSILLSMGSRSIEVRIRKLNRSGHLLYIPQTIARRLRLPHTGQCLAVAQGSREVRIGPLIGLLTTYSRSARPFGSRNALMKQFIYSGRNKSFYFTFSPRDVNWEEQTILGYF